ncbi:sortase family protein [Bifidobacterium animalis subsp. lactis CECT 8145]|nr:sortase family protein [Bifidobacterium animalis subsp. lactis CECT 8145]
MRSVVMILAEILLTVGLVCALYVVWMQWWTGVQSENRQIEERQSVGWAQPASDGANAKIAHPQQGDPPLQPEHASIGELIGRVYIPRFGDAWERNLVQGTDLAELNLHGLGHYVDSQMPGQVGNFAIAGHRNGYGQPLGDVDKLQPGDAVVVRTKDYWYVYTYTNYTIVTPDETSVISANPEDPSAPPTKRLLTMTTCEPKYTAPTHRWISFGEFKYWAKVSDGVPAELAKKGADGATKFISNEQTPFFAKLKTLQPVIWGGAHRVRNHLHRGGDRLALAAAACDSRGAPASAGCGHLRRARAAPARPRANPLAARAVAVRGRVARDHRMGVPVGGEPYRNTARNVELHSGEHAVERARGADCGVLRAARFLRSMCFLCFLCFCCFPRFCCLCVKRRQIGPAICLLLRSDEVMSGHAGAVRGACR